MRCSWSNLFSSSECCHLWFTGSGIAFDAIDLSLSYRSWTGSFGNISWIRHFHFIQWMAFCQSDSGSDCVTCCTSPHKKRCGCNVVFYSQWWHDLEPFPDVQCFQTSKHHLVWLHLFGLIDGVAGASLTCHDHLRLPELVHSPSILDDLCTFWHSKWLMFVQLHVLSVHMLFKVYWTTHPVLFYGGDSLHLLNLTKSHGLFEQRYFNQYAYAHCG